MYIILGYTTIRRFGTVCMLLSFIQLPVDSICTLLGCIITGGFGMITGVSVAILYDYWWIFSETFSAIFNGQQRSVELRVLTSVLRVFTSVLRVYTSILRVHTSDLRVLTRVYTRVLRVHTSVLRVLISVLRVLTNDLRVIYECHTRTYEYIRVIYVFKQIRRMHKLFSLIKIYWSCEKYNINY